MQLKEYLDKCQELSDIVGNNKILSKKSKKKHKKEDEIVDKYKTSPYKQLIEDEIIENLYPLIPFMNSPRFIGIKMIEESLNYNGSFEKFVNYASNELNEKKEIIFNNMQVYIQQNIDPSFKLNCTQNNYCIINFRKYSGFGFSEINGTDLDLMNKRIKDKLNEENF